MKIGKEPRVKCFKSLIYKYFTRKSLFFKDPAPHGL